MKIKKFEAPTEELAIEKVKNELGLDALVLSIKKTKPTGLFAFMRKASVEVTAAYQEGEPTDIAKPLIKEDQEIDNQADILAEKLSQTEALLAKAMGQLSIAQLEKTAKQQTIQQAQKPEIIRQERKYENNMIQVLYDALLAQGVTPAICEKILEDIAQVDEREADVGTIVTVVYHTIMHILGAPQPANTQKAQKGKPRVMAFIGPTGVGKTTTIAKLSSKFMFENGLSVAFITADTYRIAAVEQLKTYAEILGIEIGVAYNNEDLTASISKFRGINDIIMLDTAGRSHKNPKNLDELGEMLDTLQGESQQFLVLSTTTKYEDLLDIVNTYAGRTDFSLVFTKLDETMCLGAILNICYLTGKKVSYVTFGQNVPEDIAPIEPEKIARELMGLGGITS